MALDLNADACLTIAFNKKWFKDTLILNENIISFDYKKNIKGDFDVLLGGFPCVTFSMIGGRLGIKDDLNGKLYQKYAEYVEYFKPKIFIAENVKGILSANKGKALKIIQKRFEETGYNISVHLVNFADYGVPQLRERVLFVGVRKDIKENFKIPSKIHIKENYITSQEAFVGINDSLPNHIISKQKESVTERLKAIPEGKNFKALPPELAIKAKMSNVYRRLDRNKPAYTVLASGGGGTYTYHYEEPRAVTNRERARLQGFPDNYIFKGKKQEIRRQIGNAVPPVGTYPFAKEILRILNNA